MVARRKRSLGVKASWPGFIEPALASSIDKVPGGSRWIHEIKFDGYRVQVHIHDGHVKVFTRRGNDRTKRFRKIASDASEIDAGSASSMVRWSYRRQMALATSRCSRTS